MKQVKGLTHGMGIGGWLTNYKRFNVLPQERRLALTIGDMEHFESYITPWDIENIAKMGVDHIRIGFDQIVLESEPYVYREEIFSYLRTVVDACRKHNLLCVLNLHKAIGNYCDIYEPVGLLDSEELQARFVALWEKLEDEFSDCEHAYFELLNEVRDVDFEKWNDLAEKTLRAIRRKNQNRVVIIGSICWNDPNHLKELRLYDDENVIYTFHTYTPFEFTHQRGVLVAQTLYYNRVMPYPCDIERYRDYCRVVLNNPNAYPQYTEMNRDFIRDSLYAAKRFVDEHPDKTLWCGEFGTIRHAPKESRENWMADVISVLKEWEIPYCVWNYLSTPNDGNRFSLVDDETRQILTPRLAKIIRGEV